MRGYPHNQKYNEYGGDGNHTMKKATYMRWVYRWADMWNVWPRHPPTVGYEFKQAQNELAIVLTKMERSRLNITYKDRRTNIWVRERKRKTTQSATWEQMKWVCMHGQGIPTIWTPTDRPRVSPLEPLLGAHSRKDDNGDQPSGWEISGRILDVYCLAEGSTRQAETFAQPHLSSDDVPSMNMAFMWVFIFYLCTCYILRVHLHGALPLVTGLPRL